METHLKEVRSLINILDPRKFSKMYSSVEQEKQAIIDKVSVILDPKEIVKVKFLMTKLDGNLKIPVDWIYASNAILQITKNKDLFFEALKEVINIKFNEKENSVEILVNRERRNVIITDLNIEITKEQIENHFNDNHINVIQDSQLKGIWYLNYPDEASAVKATIDKHDTHIGEGEGSLVKWTLKAVTKESIRNNMLAEFQSYDNERKAKNADNKPAAK